MLTDDGYAKYLASLVPEFKPNKFLEKIKENSPVDYIQELLKVDEEGKVKEAEKEVKEEKKE